MSILWFIFFFFIAVAAAFGRGTGDAWGVSITQAGCYGDACVEFYLPTITHRKPLAIGLLQSPMNSLLLE